MTTIGTAVVRFRQGTAIALILTDEPVRTTEGYDDTRDGYACYPGRPGLIRVHRIGQGLWAEAGA